MSPEGGAPGAMPPEERQRRKETGGGLFVPHRLATNGSTAMNESTVTESLDPPPRDDAGSVASRTVAVARRIVVTVIGCTLLAVGLLFLVVPGPGLLTVWLGLGVLALEFAWARRWLRDLKRRASRIVPPFAPSDRASGSDRPSEPRRS